jgi:hypothetical protein
MLFPFWVFVAAVWLLLLGVIFGFELWKNLEYRYLDLDRKFWFRTEHTASQHPTTIRTHTDTNTTQRSTHATEKFLALPKYSKKTRTTLFVK